MSRALALVRKVVDVGALRREEFVGEFLGSSTRHIVVLTDFAGMESHKGDAEVNLREAFTILSRFPTQVVVLRGTADICRLRPRSRGLIERMIDDVRTGEFPSTCEHLYSAATAQHIRNEILQKHTRAAANFAKLEAAVEGVRDGIRKLTRSFAAADLSDLRNRRPLSPTMRHRIIQDLALLTAILYKGSTQSAALPSAKDILWSFQFRYALCSYLVSLKWVMKGGIESKPAPGLSNDFVDASYAAYATFFDGLISRDKKLTEVHAEAVWMLENIEWVSRT